MLTETDPTVNNVWNSQTTEKIFSIQQTPRKLFVKKKIWSTIKEKSNTVEDTWTGQAVMLRLTNVYFVTMDILLTTFKEILLQVNTVSLMTLLAPFQLAKITKNKTNMNTLDVIYVTTNGNTILKLLKPPLLNNSIT